jgi:hypothetical protein
MESGNIITYCNKLLLSITHDVYFILLWNKSMNLHCKSLNFCFVGSWSYIFNVPFIVALCTKQVSMGVTPSIGYRTFNKCLFHKYKFKGSSILQNSLCIIFSCFELVALMLIQRYHDGNYSLCI